jgi:hypothetical protein
MSSKTMVIHTEIRATKGTRLNDLTMDAGSRTLYDVLVLMSQKEWAQDLFAEKDGRVVPVPGYMMVLGSRMVQQWEVDDTPVNDGQNLKFVQVVPGG